MDPGGNNVYPLEATLRHSWPGAKLDTKTITKYIFENKSFADEMYIVVLFHEHLFSKIYIVIGL